LIDAGETAEESAIRELKEEVGYIGKVILVGYIIKLPTVVKLIELLWLMLL
jgi:8-oxo-dGTP pyrophosphatase MutT (NUDIX family)